MNTRATCQLHPFSSHPSLLTLIVLAILQADCSAAVPIPPEAPVTTGAPQISTMVAQYATSCHYADVGLLTRGQTSADGAFSSHSEVRFSTTFERASGEFRFNFASGDSIGSVRGTVVRSKYGPVHFWSTLEPAIREGDLHDALLFTAASSQGVSTVAPIMLLGLRSGSLLSDDFFINGADWIHGIRCDRLQARSGRRTTTLWVGQGDHALYRVQQKLVVEVADLPNTSQPSRGSALQQTVSTTVEPSVAPSSFSQESTIEYWPTFRVAVKGEPPCYSASRGSGQ